MKIVFARAATESLGLEYLSASLKARGHRTALVFEPLLFDSFRLRLPFFEPENAVRTARRVLALDPYIYTEFQKEIFLLPEGM